MLLIQEHPLAEAELFDRSRVQGAIWITNINTKWAGESPLANPNDRDKVGKLQRSKDFALRPQQGNRSLVSELESQIGQWDYRDQGCWMHWYCGETE